MEIKKLFIKKVDSKVAKNFWCVWDAFIFWIDFNWSFLSFAVKDVWFWFSFINEDWLMKILKISNKSFDEVSWIIFEDKTKVFAFVKNLLLNFKDISIFYLQILIENENKENLFKKINLNWKFEIEIKEEDIKDYDSENWKINTKKFWFIHLKDIVKLMRQDLSKLNTEAVIQEAYKAFFKIIKLRKYLIWLWISINKIKQEIWKIKSSWEDPKVFLESRNDLIEINKLKEKLQDSIFENVFNWCLKVF